jgi:hypothetical protein
MVSFGPKLLRIVVNPSAAIACTPDRHIITINAKILILVKGLPGHAERQHRRRGAFRRQ